MFEKHTKKSTGHKNFFQLLKKNKLRYLEKLFQYQLLRNWAEQSNFWWIFFYEKSFQQKKNEVLSINIEKVSILPLFCKVHYLWCQISGKKFWEKNLNLFSSKIPLYQKKIRFLMLICAHTNMKSRVRVME